jgi:hypothetical protein
MTSIIDQPIHITGARERELIAAYLGIDAQIRKLSETKTALRDQLALIVGGHRQISLDGHVVMTQAPNRRFDPSLAEELLADFPELLRACQRTAIDPATAKRVLPPGLYEKAMAETGLPRLSIADRA